MGVLRLTAFASVAFAVLALEMVHALTAQVAEPPHVTVRFASRLGLESQFVGKSARLDDQLLDWALLRNTRVFLPNGLRVPLRLAQAAYASVPVWELKEAAFTEGRLVLTLVNGATLLGQGVGSLESNDGRSFGFNGISRLTIVEISEGYQEYFSTTEKAFQESWRLTISNPTQTYTVKAPTFAFKYYSTDGYVIGGSNRVAEVKNFWVKVGAEEIETPFDGFAKIALAAGTPQSERPSITVVSPNGTTTTGSLILKAEDARGRHDASEWALHGILDGTAESRILVKGAPITLERIQ